MGKHFEEHILDAAQYDILFEDLSNNALMPYNSVPSLNEQLATNNKIIIKAINELDQNLDSSANKFQTFSDFYNGILGDANLDPTLRDNMLKIDENILKAVYTTYTALVGDPDQNISISDIANSVYEAIIKLNDEKANIDQVYTKDEVIELIDSIPKELPEYDNTKSGKVLGVNQEGILEWVISVDSSTPSNILNTYEVTIEDSTAKFLVKSFGTGITVSKTDNAKYTINIPDGVSIKSIYANFDLKEIKSNGMIEFKWNKEGKVTTNYDIEAPIYKVYNLSNNGIENSNVITKLSSTTGEFDPNYYTLTNVTSGVNLLVSLIW